MNIDDETPPTATAEIEQVVTTETNSEAAPKVSDEEFPWLKDTPEMSHLTASLQRHRLKSITDNVSADGEWKQGAAKFVLVVIEKSVEQTMSVYASPVAMQTALQQFNDVEIIEDYHWFVVDVYSCDELQFMQYKWQDFYDLNKDELGSEWWMEVVGTYLDNLRNGDESDNEAHAGSQ